MKPPICDRLRNIEVLVLDVDGVLTTGEVIYSDTGEELQRFHVHDGAGLALWHRAGKKSAIITGRGSAALERRAAELGVNPVMMKIRDKGAAIDDLLKKINVTPDQVAIVADDVPDLPMIRQASICFAVADARPDVIAAADVTTLARGGRGAVRDAVECLLKSQGHWDDLIQGVVKAVN